MPEKGDADSTPAGVSGDTRMSAWREVLDDVTFEGALKGGAGALVSPRCRRIEETKIRKASESSYHVGLTPESIIDVAADASRGTGLEAWSMRDLARRLDVAPSVVYHHVGGKDLLCRYVVERVLGMISFPTETRPWREWFRAALYPARPVLATYPGTARWLLLHGPVFASMVPVVDAGVASLDEAGFGKGAARAYASLFNTAMMTIASADDRLQHEDKNVRDHALVMREFLSVAQGSAGVSRLTRDMASQFMGSPESASAARDEYYRFILERLMDGLENTLAS